MNLTDRNKQYLSDVNPCLNSSSVTSTLLYSGKGITKSKMLLQSCAHKFPRRWAGRGPSGRTTSGP